MVLAASYEFSKQFNSEIVERPSDEIEIRELMRDLPGLNQNVREPPFCLPYCAKARVLLSAHFSRKEFPAKTLELDRQYLVKKCPYLLNEMITISYHLFTLDQMERVSFKLNLTTLDNIMKLSQMVVQGLWCHKSPLLQLPHITEDMLRYFVNKKRNIRSLKQFASMKDEERRSMLQKLSEAEYRNVMNVCAAMPDIDVVVSCEVKGEEDRTITAGSLVTVTVTLSRQSLVGDTSLPDVTEHEEVDIADDVEERCEELDDEELSKQNCLADGQTAAASNKQPKWVSKKKKGGAKKSKKKAVPTKTVIVKKPASSAATPSDERKDTVPADSASNHLSPAVETATPSPVASAKSRRKVEEDQSADDASSTDDENGEEGGDGKQEEMSGDDDEDEWSEFQRESKKDSILETKSKETHLVHCPFFPSDKYEWWWLYVSDAKKKQLVAGPVQICTLTDTDEREFRFPAPLKPGSYHYVVNVRSDSYLGLDQSFNFKIDVKEARKLEEMHPQWDFKDDEEDEDKKDDNESESNVSTDDESSGDD